MAKLSVYPDVEIHRKACEASAIPGVSFEWLKAKADGYRSEASRLRIMKAPNIVVDTFEFLHDVYDRAARMVI